LGQIRPPTLYSIQAERQRLFISREGVPASELESEVVALEIGGQFLFDMADHRDFLGAIVNLGITRDGVGFCGGLLVQIEVLLFAARPPAARFGWGCVLRARLGP